MTFQEAVAERDRLAKEYARTLDTDVYCAYCDAQNRIDQMLSDMSREMDMERFDEEAFDKQCPNVDTTTPDPAVDRGIQKAMDELGIFPPLEAEQTNDTPTDRARDAALRDCKG